MEGGILFAIGISIIGAALIGYKSGVATAFIEIIAGVLIGVGFGINHLPESLSVMSELGIVSLMFIAGLEVDWHFIRNKGKDGVKLGIVAFILPLIVMTGITMAVFALDFKAGLLVAIGLAECSAGIVYPVLRKKGSLGPRRKIVLSAAMVMELLAIILLSLLFTELSWMMLLVIPGILLFRALLPRLHQYISKLDNDSQESIAIKFVMAVLLTTVFVAAQSGIEPIIVAFIMGMIMSQFIQGHRQLLKEIEVIGFGLLTPVFFLGVGINLQVTQLIQFFVAIVLLTATTILIKTAAIYLTARKVMPKRARTVSILLNAPMSVGIVTATIGLEKGIITPEMYSILIGAVLLSSFLAVVFGKYPEDIPSPVITQ